MKENPTAIQLLERAAYVLSEDETQETKYLLGLEIEAFLEREQQNANLLTATA